VALLAVSSIPAAPVLGLMALGVIIAIVGHAVGSRGTVATGLTILFLATGGMVAAGFAAFHGGESDPRTQCSPYPGVNC
jgi:hypothetical protein